VVVAPINHKPNPRTACVIPIRWTILRRKMIYTLAVRVCSDFPSSMTRHTFFQSNQPRACTVIDNTLLSCACMSFREKKTYDAMIIPIGHLACAKSHTIFKAMY
jgi:hypothetical protein